MSKEQDKYIMQNLYNKIMPLYVATTMCEAQAYQDRERKQYKTSPYKQTRNKDKSITDKRRQLKKEKKKNRK